MHGRDRGLQLVRAERRAAEHAAHERDALGDQRAVPARPVLLVERDERAVGARAFGATRVGEQHEREQAGDLAVVGEQRVQHAGEPDRLGGEVGALQVVARRGRVALVEDEVEHLQHDAQPLGALVVGRERGTSAPAVLIDCLARLMRCAIVASGTRNAAAISAVVSPPTARSVSASCDGGESDGWQHRNSSVSVSSS